MRQYSPPRLRGRRFRCGALLACMLLLVHWALPVPGRAAAGDVDLTYGFFGRVVLQANFGGSFNALQADDKIVSSGRGVGVGLSDISVARLTPEGVLDPAFGDGGHATVNFGFTGGFDSIDTAFGVAVQPDGRIVAAGITNALNMFKWDFAFARFDADGSLDPTFGNAGRAVFGFGHVGSDDQLRAVVVQPDGRILSGGYSDLGTFAVRDFVVGRLTPDGLPDPTFGVDGRVSLDFNGASSLDEGVALALQPDGRIILAGTSRPLGGTFNFALARFEPDGALDAGFGAGGKALIDPAGVGVGASLTDVALAPGGKIVVVGFILLPGVPSTSRDFLVLRLEPDGSLDTSFGAGGRVILDLSGAGSDDRAFSAAVQEDGKILVGGETRSPSTVQSFVLVRLDPDGVLDGSFGSGGMVQTRVGPVTASEGIRKVLLQSDRKIVASGFSGFLGVLVRYLNDPLPDEQLEDLIALIKGLGLLGGTEQSLLVKLEHALAVLDEAAPDATCRLLRAFENQVSALGGKNHLTQGTAEELRARTADIRALLGCQTPGGAD